MSKPKKKRGPSAEEIRAKQRRLRSRTAPAPAFVEQRVRTYDPPAHHDPDAEPPPGMVETYAEVAEFVAENPDGAGEIMELEEDLIGGLVAGIAWADHFGYAEEECLQRAHVIQYWAVLNGIIYLFEWPTPVAAMSEEEIVAACRADRQSGLIPLPHK